MSLTSLSKSVWLESGAVTRRSVVWRWEARRRDYGVQERDRGSSLVDEDEHGPVLRFSVSVNHIVQGVDDKITMQRR